MIRNMTCIVCPMGCNMEVSIENQTVTAVKGNSCPRGKQYAENECTDPKRTVTSIMRCENGEMVSVKTDCAVKKSDVFAVIDAINNHIVPLPVHVGDVIMENVYGSNIVATKNVTGD